MATKNISIDTLAYGEGTTGTGLTSGTSADTFYIRGVNDASKTGLVMQSTQADTKLQFSTTDVDYTGAGAGELEISLGTTDFHFAGPFDGTRLMVETSTGRYIQFSIDSTGGTAALDVAAFEM